MPAKIDRIGETFGRLTIIDHERIDGVYYYWCTCECGAENIRVQTGSVVNGRVVSCGCYNRDRITTHGLRYTPEYYVYKAAKSRCYNKNDPNYFRYGGRNIRMSKRWFHNVKEFYKDMGPRPSPKHSIERRDNNKGYNKKNCYWALQIEQDNNRRSNVFFTYKGVTKTIAQWARSVGLSRMRLWQRLIRDGWPIQRALSEHTVDGQKRIKLIPLD